MIRPAHGQTIKLRFRILNSNSHPRRVVRVCWVVCSHATHACKAVRASGRRDGLIAQWKTGSRRSDALPSVAGQSLVWARGPGGVDGEQHYMQRVKQGCEEGTPMPKVILSIAASLIFASSGYAQTSALSVGAPTTISPNGPMYPAPLKDYSNPSVYSFRR